MTTYDSTSDDGPSRAEENLGLRPVPRIAIQAFCETPDVAAVLEKAAADRRMNKAHVKIHMGGSAAALDFYASAPTPNLLFVETREKRDAVIEQLEQLAAVCDAGTKVVLIGHTNDVGLYRELLRRGVSDYLVFPFDLFDVIHVIGDIFLGQGSRPIGRTIAFIGARGGVGSSTIAHNVGFSLSRQFESDVVIADFDLPFGTAGLDFNQDPPQGIADALSSPDRIDDVFLDRILTKCASNLNLLAAPATLERAYDHGEYDFDTIVEGVRTGVPAVVLDLPHQWTGWVRHLINTTDEVVVTAGPDLASLRNAKNLFDQIRLMRPNDLTPKLVINQVGMPKRPEIKPEDFRKALDLQPTIVVGFDAQLFGNATNNGQMIAEINAKSPVATQFDHLAAAVAGRTVPKAARKTSLAPLLARLPRLGRKAG